MKLVKRFEQRELGPRGGGLRYVGIFHCDWCGKNVKKELYKGLKYKSCGCQQTPAGERNPKYRHGASSERLYWIWAGMLSRCKNGCGNANTKKNYVERGIAVCDEWKIAANFIAWAKESGYRHGLWIDRIDNDLGYFPGNCRWVTPKESCQNRRLMAASAELLRRMEGLLDSGLTVTQVAEALGMKYGAVRHRTRAYRLNVAKRRP